MEFCAGYAGGVAGVLASHPLDVIRTRQAVNHMTMSDTVRLLAKETGWIRSMYKGIYSPCLGVGLWKGVMLGVYNMILPPKTTTTPVLYDTMVASSVAGTLAAAVLGPLEAVKVRTMTAKQQLSGTGEGKSLIQLEREALSTIKGREILRSTWLLCLRDCYASIGFLVPYEFGKSYIESTKKFNSTSLMPAFFAGMVAGPLGWAVCYPIEVYRIHALDTNFTNKFNGRAGLLAMAKAIHTSGGGGFQGLRAWFRGLPACALRASVQIPTTMVVFEYIRTWGSSAC